MTGKKAVIILDPMAEEISELTFEELCSASQASPEFILELIAYGTIEPQGNSPMVWRFHAEHLRVIRMAIHLHHDLEINQAGIALAMDLIAEIDALRARLEMLEKYVSR